MKNSWKKSIFQQLREFWTLTDNLKAFTFKVSLDLDIDVFLNSCVVFRAEALNSILSLYMGLFPTALINFLMFSFYKGEIESLLGVLEREHEAR